MINRKRVPLPEPVSNVVQLRPLTRHDIRTAETTGGHIRSVRTTGEVSKKDSYISDKDAALTCSEETAHTDVSCVRANAELTKAQFHALVRRLKSMDLIKRFKLDYSSWRDMHGRRRNGCEIAPEFRVFRSFLRHMEMPRPSTSYTLDRIDPFKKVYGPGLVRWASKRVQANNRTDTIHLTGPDGRTLPLTDWAAITKQDPKTLRQRRSRHPEWSDVEIIDGHQGGKPGALGSPQAPAATLLPYAEGWPSGLARDKVAKWEAGFQAFAPCARQMFPRSGTLGLTRAAFFVWIGENAVRSARERLAAHYPGYGDPEVDPADLDWSAIEIEPDFARLLRAEPLLRAARDEVWATDPRDEVVTALRRGLPKIDAPDPNRLGRLRWRCSDQ